MVSLGDPGPRVFLLQVLYSVISDLVEVQRCPSVCSSDPQGVPSPLQPSPLPQLTGNDPRSAEQPVRVCVCVNVHMWSWQVKRLFDIINIHRRQTFLGSEVVLFLLSSHQQRTQLKTHIGVCQRVRTLFTLHCSRGLLNTFQWGCRVSAGAEGRQWVADCSNLFNLWLGPGMSTMRRH